MQITSFRPPAPLQLRPLFDPDQPSNDEEQGYPGNEDPNPDGYEPNWRLVTGLVGAGAVGGFSLAALASQSIPGGGGALMAIGAIGGGYLGGAIGMILSSRSQE